MTTRDYRRFGGPTLPTSSDRWANAFAGQGALASLDDRVPQEYIDTLTDFHWSEFATPAGEHFGVPLTFNIQALIVNKTALDAAGVDIPATFEEGWSWNELIDVGRKDQTVGCYGIRVQLLVQLNTLAALSVPGRRRWKYPHT